MYCENRATFTFGDDFHYSFTEDYLDESLLVYMTSIEFLETIYREIQNMWSNQISETIDYMKTVRDDVPLFRIFEVISIVHLSFDLLQCILNIFFNCFELQITFLYKEIPTSNWDFVVFSDYENSCVVQIARKSVISNMSLNPIVVQEQKKINTLSLPVHISVTKPHTSSNCLPDVVVYLGNMFVFT